MRKGRCILLVACTSIILLLLAGCSTSIPFLGLTVKAVDENNQPLSGATVHTSGGDLLTTGADGTASVRFSKMMGSYTIEVGAPGRQSNTIVVSLPLDVGKEKIVRLPRASTASAASTSPIATNGMGMMGAGFSSMMMTQLYPMIFQSLFTSNGYNLDFTTYQPGEWTEWRVSSDNKENGMTMRKAFLKRLDNKQEWWQVKLKGEKKGKDLIFEVLFSADRQSIRRMRNLGENGKPAEVPVSEGWYSAPTKLTQESLEGSLTKKSDSVKVPAGSFKADLYEFSSYGGAIKMWRTKGVPGELVKSQLSDGDDDVRSTTELLKYGADAKTELASY